MNKFLIGVIFTSVLIFLARPVSAANFQDAKITISDPRPAAESTLKAEFDTQSDLTDGYFLVMIPTQFDLTRLNSSNIKCEALQKSAQKLIWTNVTISENEIKCFFQGKIAAGSKIKIQLPIAQGGARVINPSSVGIYSIGIRSLDKAENLVDRINVKIALYKMPRASGQVGMTATVGKYEFKIFGYTSPKARVRLEATNIKEQANALQNGYFEFTGFLPLKSQEPCLFVQDILGRVSPPLCLAPLPTNSPITIGPILMAPTISLDRPSYFIGEKGLISGQTMPNTKVNLSLFRDSRRSTIDFIDNKLTLGVSPVLADSLPTQAVKSDKNGYFSAKIPTSSSSLYRTFAQANWQGSPSPKSLTLNISIFPWWIVLTRLMYNNFLAIIFLLVSFIIYWLITRFFHPEYIAFLYHRHRQRAIVLAKKDPLTLLKKRYSD